VNPIVALGLGALVLGETVGRSELVATALVVTGVVIVAGASRARRNVPATPVRGPAVQPEAA